MKAVLVVAFGAVALGTPPGLVEVTLPNSRGAPAALAWGYDGKMYGVEYALDRFFRLEPRTNRITGEWAFPTLDQGFPIVALPGRIVAGAENGIEILDLTKGVGTVTEVPLNGVSVAGLAVDRSTGTVYFTDAHSGAIGKLVGTTATTLAVLRSRRTAPCIAYGIVFEPRTKNLFVDCQGSNEIWTLRPDGSTSTYSIPVPNPLPEDLVLGRDGNVYVSLFDAGTVARFNPRSGKFTTWNAPSSAKVAGLAFDSSDRLWFGLPNKSGVDRLDRAKTAQTQYQLADGSEPAQLAAGPNGRVFYSDLRRNVVGSFAPPVVTVASQRVFSRDLYKRTAWSLKVVPRAAPTVDVLAAPGTTVTLKAPYKVTRLVDEAGHQRFRVAAPAGRSVSLALDVHALEPQTATVRVSPVR